MRVITVARKPLEGTVAQNVLKWGCGGLNIDACRIGVTTEDAQGMDRCNSPGSGHFSTAATPIGTFKRSSPSAPLNTTQGRWPANLILMHLPGCQQVGTGLLRVPKERVIRQSAGYEGFSLGKDSRQPGHHSASPGNGDGTETVPTWNCEPGCPVAALDEQSGISKTGDHRPHIQATGTHGFNTCEVNTFENKGDVGGASRFFKQVQTK